MNKNAFVAALRRAGWNHWAGEVEDGRVQPVFALKTLSMNMNDSDVLALCDAITEKSVAVAYGSVDSAHVVQTGSGRFNVCVGQYGVATVDTLDEAIDMARVVRDMEKSGMSAWDISQTKGVSPRTQTFFMVYREGGNPPKFRHDTRASAELEATRIARESGDDTYVLAVVAKREGRSMPTNDEVRKHAEGFQCELSMNGHKWGLWRVTPQVGLPRLVAATPGYSDSPIFSDGVTCIRPPVGKWEPVTKSGDSIEDIPF